jgi:hypothetical protein
MMTWEALGSLALVLAALAFTGWMIARLSYAAGYEAHRQDMAVLRAERRAEARALAARRGHSLAPFPADETWERLTSTGDLAALTEMAETGDLAGIRGFNAAFIRVLDLRRWVRAA